MEKVKINIELDRGAFELAAQLSDIEITDELWGKLTAAPVNVNIKDFNDKEAELGLKIALTGLAFMSISK